MAITTTRRMGELSKWETSWPKPPPPYACCYCRRWWRQRWSEVCFFVWISLFLLLIFVSTARRQWHQCSLAVTTPPMRQCPWTITSRPLCHQRQVKMYVLFFLSVFFFAFFVAIFLYRTTTMGRCHHYHIAAAPWMIPWLLGAVSLTTTLS